MSTNIAKTTPNGLQLCCQLKYFVGLNCLIVKSYKMTMIYCNPHDTPEVSHEEFVHDGRLKCSYLNFLSYEYTF